MQNEFCFGNLKCSLSKILNNLWDHRLNDMNVWMFTNAEWNMACISCEYPPSIVKFGKIAYEIWTYDISDCYTYESGVYISFLFCVRSAIGIKRHIFLVQNVICQFSIFLFYIMFNYKIEYVVVESLFNILYCCSLFTVIHGRLRCPWRCASAKQSFFIEVNYTFK